jgi:hypothetical protein|tara:strand:+ start:8409 stop:9077 length:669 start_codon:yes stop_codon:yes gene_type:complete
MIHYSGILTVKCLRKICRIYKIKIDNYINKHIILNILNKYSAAKVIQKNFRKILDFNESCPISHEELRYPWVCIKNNKKYIYYDFDTFVFYLNKLSDFRDPCTRIKLSNKKIEDINKLIIYYNRKSSNKLIISDDMIKNIDLNILTYCLYDIIKDINAKELNLEETYKNYLPRFIFYFTHLVNNHSKEMSSMLLKACKETLNKQIIIDYIDVLENINKFRDN